MQDLRKYGGDNDLKIMKIIYNNYISTKIF